jgi:uncharacterized pyridoxamine 5'-phosphate oxidase family protein
MGGLEMDYKNEFNHIMAEQNEIALATCIEGTPNVRIVNFFCDATQNSVIYFSTFRDNQKVEEFGKNDTVAFTTVPHVGNAHVRVKNAVVKRSSKSIYDLKEEFIKKTPDYEMTIEQAGEYLALFEVHFKEAKVTVDLDNSGTIML